MIPEKVGHIVIPRMTNVSITPIAQFSNSNVQIIFGKIDEPANEFEYLITATHDGGLGRITLGGTKEQLLRFFEKGMEALLK